MKTALDTNILAGLLAQTPRTSTILEHLGHCKQHGPIIISPPVYAESLANRNLTHRFLSLLIARTGIHLDYAIQESVWTKAGERYARYAERRRQSAGDSPRRILAHFLIGAHALTYADRLMTYDTKVYRQDFPELPLYPLPGL